MALRIGNKEVIRQETLLLPKDEGATVPLTFGGTNWTVEIALSTDESKQPNFKGSIKDGAISIEFINWNDGLGVSMQEPLELAKFENGRALLLMGAGQGIGDTTKLDLQFMLA